MNKRELIDGLSEALGGSISKADLKNVLDAFQLVVTQELVEGGAVQLQGLGVFETREQAATTARNLHTNEPVQVPARTVPKFRVSNVLKTKIRESARALA
ncbi:HU family DNA-binding protein [Nonomuraea sp. NPDC050404]|uniref:HU family DNA-binding protein n=1 Tax=Nonomuraea sp. NPDC050404 TaxID=3155783 RepID=UPI0033F426CD